MEETINEDESNTINRTINQTTKDLEIITETEELILKTVVTKDKVQQEILKKEDQNSNLQNQENHLTLE